MRLRTAHGLPIRGTLPVTLKSTHGFYLCALEEGVLEWNREEVGPWEIFECTVENGKATFKTAHGKYLCADGENLVCDRDEPGEWETFELVTGEGGKGFALKTAHGKFVCADEQTAVANRDDVGAWETFTSDYKDPSEGTTDTTEEPTIDVETEDPAEPTDEPAEPTEEPTIETDADDGEKTYGFTDKEAKYEDVPWANLPSDAREAAELIGFDESTWDGKEWLHIDDKHWRDLSPEEREACETLGWSKHSWDTKYEGVYWESLPDYVKRACERMGWDQTSWDDDWDVECWDKDWEEFDDEEKRCMHVLGYYVHTW